MIGVSLTRLSMSMIGVVLALGAGGIGIAATFWPQPLALAASACQPGVLVTAAVLAIQVAVRWYHRQRAIYLPGFARTVQESASMPIPVKGPSTARNRPASTGSSGGRAPCSHRSGRGLTDGAPALASACHPDRRVDRRPAIGGIRPGRASGRRSGRRAGIG